MVSRKSSSRSLSSIADSVATLQKHLMQGDVIEVAALCSSHSGVLHQSLEGVIAGGGEERCEGKEVFRLP